jgi:hypothetical protein
MVKPKKPVATTALIVLLTFSFLVHEASAQANPTPEDIAKFPAPQRNERFTAGLQQSGMACDKVVESVFQGFDKKKSGIWNVRCRDGQAYVIMVAVDPRESRILECSFLKAFGGTDCFKKL